MFTISILMSQLFLQYFTQSDDVKEVYCQVSISTTYLINGQYVSFTGGEILYFCYITKTMRTYLSNFSEEEYSVNKWINYCMPEACFSIISCWMVDKWMILLSDTVSQCFVFNITAEIVGCDRITWSHVIITFSLLSKRGCEDLFWSRW